MITRLVFAYGAGLLGPVNPCGLGILPAYLSYYVTGSETPPQRRSFSRFLHGLTGGGAVSLGYAAVNLTLGLLVAAGLRPLLDYIPAVAVAIGATLAVLGLAALFGRKLPFVSLDLFRQDGERGYRPMMVFGGAYALASLSCSIGVLMAVAGQALATSSIPGLLAVYAAYGAGSATLLVTLSVSAAVANGVIASGLRRILPVLDYVTGGLLLFAGLFLVAYWLPAVTDSTPNANLSTLAGDISAWFTDLLQSQQTGFALIGATLAVVGIATALAKRSARPSTTAARDDEIEPDDWPIDDETPDRAMPSGSPPQG